MISDGLISDRLLIHVASNKFGMEKETKGGQLVFVVGMPAVGKTYWGKRMAKEFNRPFADLDVFIGEQEQASVPALFAMYGEGGFREREEKYLKQLIQEAEAGTIIGCGGGTPCYKDNMQVMKNAGTVVYLQADTAILLEHLAASDEVRPLLNNRGDAGVYLEGLLQKRKSYYEQSHFILQIADISRSTFAKILTHE